MQTRLGCVPPICSVCLQTNASFYNWFLPISTDFCVNIRGPLEVLRDNWLEGVTPDSSLLEWVKQVRRNLCDFAVIAGDKTVLSKCKMKQYYDKSVKGTVSFEPGGMVLVRTPGLSAKFTDSWSLSR